MRKKSVISLVISSVIIILTAALSGSLLYAKAKTNVKVAENKALINKIEELTSQSDRIDFKDIDDFQWDRLYIITPYGIPEKILKSNDVKWVSISSHIDYEDDINLLVFTYKGNIVSYVNYPRSKGDFYPVEHNGFDIDRAVFKVENIDNQVKIKHID